MCMLMVCKYAKDAMGPMAPVLGLWYIAITQAKAARMKSGTL